MLIKINYVVRALINPSFNVDPDAEQLQVISKCTTINTDYILFIDHNYSKALANSLRLARFSEDVITSDYCFDKIKMTDGRILMVEPDTTEKVIGAANH